MSISDDLYIVYMQRLPHVAQKCNYTRFAHWISVQQTTEFFDPSPCFVLGDSSPQLSVTLSLSLSPSYPVKTAQIKALFMCVRQRKSRERICVTSVIPVLLNVFNRALVCVYKMLIRCL